MVNFVPSGARDRLLISEPWYIHLASNYELEIKAIFMNKPKLIKIKPTRIDLVK